MSTEHPVPVEIADRSAGAPRSADIHQIEDVLQPIPEAVRTSRVSGQFWIWAGANIAPINWVLGALGIGLGLGLRDTLIALIVGNVVGMALFGVFVLIGQRTGVTGMVLSRAAFGRRGAYVPAAIQALLAIGWCAVNTWIILDLVMALLGQLHLVDPEAPNISAKIVVAALIMAIQVTIAWLGYRAIATFERWTVPPTLAVLILMSVVAWFHLPIDWSYAGPSGTVLQGAERIAAMSAVMTVIGIGWGITWFTYACDYSRFVSRQVPPRKLYFASTLGQFIPVVWLGVLGASLATTNGDVDPGELIVSNFGSLALPVLFLVIHGPIATNILNIYTFSVATQALDVKLSRRKLNLLVGAFALVVVVFFVFQSNLATVLSTWLGAIVAWIASWAGIIGVHYFLVERGNLDAQRLFEPVGSRRLPDVNWTTMGCFLAGIVGTWMFMYGPLPVMQGFGSRAMDGLDLSWLAGGVIAGGLYAVFGPRAYRRNSDTATRSAAHTAEGTAL